MVFVVSRASNSSAKVGEDFTGSEAPGGGTGYFNGQPYQLSARGFACRIAKLARGGSSPKSLIYLPSRNSRSASSRRSRRLAGRRSWLAGRAARAPGVSREIRAEAPRRHRQESCSPDLRRGAGRHRPERLPVKGRRHVAGLLRLRDVHVGGILAM